MAGIETSGELHRGGSVTLNAAGAGSVMLMPDNAHQRWEITSVVVSTNQAATATPVPVAEIFVNGTQSRMNSRGATWSGNQDSFDGLVRVGPCDYLTIQFTAGISGVIASVVIVGTYYTRRG